MRFLNRIGVCQVKILHGHDPGALVPALSYQERKKKIVSENGRLDPGLSCLLEGVNNISFHLREAPPKLASPLFGPCP